MHIAVCVCRAPAVRDAARLAVIPCATFRRGCNPGCWRRVIFFAAQGCDGARRRRFPPSVEFSTDLETIEVWRWSPTGLLSFRIANHLATYLRGVSPPTGQVGTGKVRSWSLVFLRETSSPPTCKLSRYESGALPGNLRPTLPTGLAPRGLEACSVPISLH